MLPFFRNHAGKIVIAVLIFFGATMFTGAFFFGGPSGADLETQNTQVQQSDFAIVGSIPVNQQKFAEFLEQSFVTLRQNPDLSLSPEIIEFVQYSSFLKAVQYTVFLEKAKENNAKVTKYDLKVALESVYASFDVKDLKELKSVLKKNNYPYSQFIDTLKQDIQVQKISDSIKAGVTVTDQDVMNLFKEVKVRHILLQPKEDEEKDALTLRMKTIQQALKAGQSFATLAKAYSVDQTTATNGGDLGWIKVGDTVDPFEKVAYSLGKGEISEPVYTNFGLHLIQVLDTKSLTKPKNFDKEKAKVQIRVQKESNVIENIVQGYIQQNPIEINNPFLKAYKAKMESRFDDAVSAYQTQVSLNPDSAMPHYLLSKVYQATAQKDLVEEQLRKADIKAELNPKYDFPEIHMDLGLFYDKLGKKTERNEQYDKAIDLVKNSLPDLNKLSNFFKQVKQPRWGKKVTTLITKVEKERAKQAEKKQEPSKVNLSID